MSRFIPDGDMTADQLLKCSYQAQAIISLCSRVADNLSSSRSEAVTGGNIASALDLALELVGVMHDALETHEGLKGGSQ